MRHGHARFVNNDENGCRFKFQRKETVYAHGLRGKSHQGTVAGG